MLQVRCPYCGVREISEFSCHSEAHISRPLNSEKLSDEQWGDYQFFRSNPKGIHADRWMHAAGCRRWFNMLRNTATDEILETYKIGARPRTRLKPSPKLSPKPSPKPSPASAKPLKPKR